MKTIQTWQHMYTMTNVCICSRVDSKDDLRVLATIDLIRDKYNVKGVFLEYDEIDYDIGDELLTYSLKWGNVHICFSDYRLHTSVYSNCMSAIRSIKIKYDQIISVDRLDGCKVISDDDETNNGL